MIIIPPPPSDDIMITERKMTNGEHDLCHRKDEHSLIAAYCQKLSEGHLSHLIPESPMQVKAATSTLSPTPSPTTNHQVASEIDGEQRKELEHMILELEAENANLKEEYNHLKIVGASQMGPMSTNQPEVILLCIFHRHHPYHH